MCGILGSVGRDLDEQLLASLKHRGPDGQGLKKLQAAGRDLWLGHTRLAILDLSEAGHQPMRSRDGRWWITFNGEIYNHGGLRDALPGPFCGNSDTETLVESLANRGLDHTLKQLDGMFAFAALDTHEGQLYLVRDPVGIKPIYFSRNRGDLIFASEARTLRQLKLGKNLHDRGLRQFLTLRYVPSPNTLWQGIERLPPGHVLRYDLDRNETTTWNYVEPMSESFQGSLDDAVQAYQETLSAAVRRQLLSDVPVGVLLSGGVDSALVAAMAKEAGETLPAFTVGFGDEQAECEIADAAHTAKALGLPFHPVIVTPEELKTTLPAIASAVEEPLGSTSIMPMWALVRRARESVTVVLTGQGTDEPWGGYFRYQIELLRDRLPMPSSMFRPMAWLARQLPMLPEAAERGLRTLAQSDAAMRIIEASALFPAHERRRLLGNEDDGGARTMVDEWLQWLEGQRPFSPVERMMRLDTRMNLADDLLLYGDKISMAFSLEARVPMLDLDLLGLVESLPLDYRIRWRQGKIGHKLMAKRYLPEAIVHRPKRGFQVPFGRWSRGPWKSWVEFQLLEGLSGLLDKDALERLWRQHLQRKPDRSRQMFSLLMLSLWNRNQAHG